MALDTNEDSRHLLSRLRVASPWERAAVAAALMPPVWVWRAPASDEILVGFGYAESFSSLRECRAALQAHRPANESAGIEPRCFCVLAFDPARPMALPWDGFPGWHFILPQVLVRWNNSGVVGWWCARGDSPQTDLLKHLQSVTRAPRVARIIHRRDLVTKTDWDARTCVIRDAIRSGEVSKVVLARVVELEASAVFDVSWVLDKLSAVTDSYQFAYGTGAGTFLGASPERLFRLDGDIVSADSLAGTRPRGRSDGEDAALTTELLDSAKDQGEQQQVTQFLADRLGTLCNDVHVDARHVAKFKSVQHLRNKVTGRLRNRTSPDDILYALHPTPAVCGNPRVIALDWIRKHEPLPRGLYAGAIGWISRDAAEFAVAIRSALLTDRRAYLFAGAGIMADSDPQSEWEETEWKMGAMLNILAGDVS